MGLKKNVQSILSGIILGMSSADKNILKSMLDGEDSGTLQATHNTQYSPTKLLQGFQKGELQEQYREWFYRVLERADEIAMETVDIATGKSQRQLLTEELELRGGKGIENIIPCKPIVSDSADVYYPVRSNGKVESYSEQLYVRSLGGEKKSLEFHVDVHSYKHVLENIKTRGNVLNDLRNTTQIEFDKVIFDNELTTYVDQPCNYLVNYSEFYMSENPGYFVIKFITT
ncbi:hypothetical protein COB55_06035 [Candidatus Wolfebacteria bacterium]|nr:MAG: hypothetical protein COB55_06035 [Candidatus Wolfebacteria bacterium]